MRAVVVTEFGGPEAVEIAEVEVPEPGARQIRIKVAAAALNPVDAGVRAGGFGGAGRRLGLGWDVAGTVDAVGADAGWRVGDEVVALSYGRSSPRHARRSRGRGGGRGGRGAELGRPRPCGHPAPQRPHRGPGPGPAGPGARAEPGGDGCGGGGRRVRRPARRPPGSRGDGVAREGDEELVRSLGRPTSPRVAWRAWTGCWTRRFSARRRWSGCATAGCSWASSGDASGVRTGVRTDSVEVRADGARLAELVALVDEGVLTTRVADTYRLEEAGRRTRGWPRAGCGGGWS
ncbi:NADP-dependent oxidoreductase [Streptomyces mirabilis]|nr:NADP-dependent oxidoreductase [Streptomyces mirabilis]